MPLKRRNPLKEVVGSENNDRQVLDQAIANANGPSEWDAQIKATFAHPWLSNANSGWGYQNAKGTWQQR